MKYRKLRIAWSVVCGMFCLLLIVLWVRSFYRYDEVLVTVSDNIGVWLESMPGQMNVSRLSAVGGIWILRSTSIEEEWEFPPHVGLTVKDGRVWIPHWFPAWLLAMFATLPWMRQLSWRFSLRTLLIAMTLVAAGLGLIVALSR